jgi:hypothetical protein
MLHGFQNSLARGHFRFPFDPFGFGFFWSIGVKFERLTDN